MDYYYSDSVDLLKIEQEIKFQFLRGETVTYPSFSNDISDIVTKYGVEATFGKGQKEITDHEFRKAIFIEKNCYTTNLTDILEATGVFAKVKEVLKFSDLTFKLDKLNVYREGDFFTLHRDTPDHNTIATFMVLLPEYFTGGDFVVHQTRTKNFHFNLDNMRELKWIVFFSDNYHQVEPVQKGNRLTVTFQVRVPDDYKAEIPLQLAPKLPRVDGFLKDVIDCYLNADETFYIGYFCRQYYHSNDIKLLKGLDLEYFSYLKQFLKSKGYSNYKIDLHRVIDDGQNKLFEGLKCQNCGSYNPYKVNASKKPGCPECYPKSNFLVPVRKCFYDGREVDYGCYLNYRQPLHLNILWLNCPEMESISIVDGTEEAFHLGNCPEIYGRIYGAYTLLLKVEKEDRSVDAVNDDESSLSDIDSDSDCRQVKSIHGKKLLENYYDQGDYKSYPNLLSMVVKIYYSKIKDQFSELTKFT